MRAIAVRFSVFSALVLSCCFGQSNSVAPKFEAYRVEGVYRGPVKPPNVGRLDQYSGTDLRCFGEDPATYTSMRVNFAGHFILRTCSCGTGCHYFFLWDARNGNLYRTFPFGPINVGPYGTDRNAGFVEYAGEQYRTDSSMLILDGCSEGTCDCAKRYYVWSAGNFKLIRRETDRLPPDCRH